MSQSYYPECLATRPGLPPALPSNYITTCQTCSGYGALPCRILCNGSNTMLPYGGAFYSRQFDLNQTDKEEDYREYRRVLFFENPEDEREDPDGGRATPGGIGHCEDEKMDDDALIEAYWSTDSVATKGEKKMAEYNVDEIDNLASPAAGDPAPDANPQAYYLEQSDVNFNEDYFVDDYGVLEQFGTQEIESGEVGETSVAQQNGWIWFDVRETVGKADYVDGVYITGWLGDNDDWDPEQGVCNRCDGDGWEGCGGCQARGYRVIGERVEVEE